MGDDPRQNGAMKSSLLKIERSVAEIKDDLTLAVQDLTRASREISHSLEVAANSLGEVVVKFESLEKMWGSSIPIKLVFLLFGLVFLIVGGIEALQWLFKVKLAL